MTHQEVLAKIDTLFLERGSAEYHGEAVTQLEHALQCAWMAEQDGHPAEVIAAALLHDVGHLLHGHGEDYLDHDINDRHEDIGARFLSRAFGPAVTEPIRMHVPAKRYLTAVRAAYFASLSPSSVQSLELQGGPMKTEEISAFEQLPQFSQACVLREYDDRAKITGLQTPTYAHFRVYLEKALTTG
jgi:[1-hydroxy-2-(trimethylamino)ethyl]phosphonate dioxygenase